MYVGKKQAKLKVDPTLIPMTASKFSSTSRQVKPLMEFTERMVCQATIRLQVRGFCLKTISQIGMQRQIDHSVAARAVSSVTNLF